MKIPFWIKAILYNAAIMGLGWLLAWAMVPWWWTLVGSLVGGVVLAIGINKLATIGWDVAVGINDWMKREKFMLVPLYLLTVAYWIAAQETMFFNLPNLLLVAKDMETLKEKANDYYYVQIDKDTAGLKLWYDKAIDAGVEATYHTSKKSKNNYYSLRYVVLIPIAPERDSLEAEQGKEVYYLATSTDTDSYPLQHISQEYLDAMLSRLRAQWYVLPKPHTYKTRLIDVADAEQYIQPGQTILSLVSYDPMRLRGVWRVVLVVVVLIANLFFYIFNQSRKGTTV